MTPKPIEFTCEPPQYRQESKWYRYDNIIFCFSLLKRCVACSVPCAEGKVPTLSGNACFACPKGTRRDDTMSACQKCSGGQYTSDAIQCRLCPVAQEQNDDGSGILCFVYCCFSSAVLKRLFLCRMSTLRYWIVTLCCFDSSNSHKLSFCVSYRSATYAGGCLKCSSPRRIAEGG
jgi:hypothetical protein